MRALDIAGVTVHLDLIAGLPHEDFESFKKSFNFAFDLKPDELQLGFLKLLPGTELHLEAEDYGIICDEFPPYEIISNRWLSAEEIIRLKNIEAVLDIFHNSGMLKYTEKKLISCFDSPFEMFEKIAEYFTEKGYLDFPHHKADYLEFLKDFAAAYSMEEEITKDFVLTCRKKPDWADEKELEKIRINELLAEGDFENLPLLSLIKPAERHKFVKFYRQGGKVFIASYPDMRVEDITADYKKL